MRHLILSTVFALAMSAPLAANETAIQSTISEQISAFQVDDFESAFRFASPSIKTMFGSPENFGTMVRQGYPMVWRPAKIEYLGLRSMNGQMIQHVLITDQSGALHTLAYVMEQTSAGWQINGVQLLKEPQVGA